MAITNAQVTKLNKMNRAAQDAELGTSILNLQNGAVVAGTYTMVAADATAGTKAIATGLGKNISGFIVQIYRANVLVSGATTTKSSANLTVATNGTTYVVTAGDVVNYIVF